MLIHSTQKKILGFITPSRLAHLQNKKCNISNIFEKYPIKQTSDILLFSSIDHILLDTLCLNHKIKNIIGYNPLNLPIKYEQKYNFTSCLDDSSLVYCQPTPISIKNNIKFIKNFNDCMILIPIYDPNIEKYIYSTNLNIITKITKNSIILNASEHWYDDPIRHFQNPWPLILCNTITKTSEKYECQFDDSIFQSSESISINQDEVYTDASIKNKKTAIGIWSSDFHFYSRLNNVDDINQAELIAILMALIYVESHYKDKNIIVKSDSLTALDLISGKNKNPKYATIIESIHKFKNAIFTKVKAHSGIIGNENADFLAKYATTYSSNSLNIKDIINI